METITTAWMISCPHLKSLFKMNKSSHHSVNQMVSREPADQTRTKNLYDSLEIRQIIRSVKTIRPGLPQFRISVLIWINFRRHFLQILLMSSVSQPQNNLYRNQKIIQSLE